MNPSTRGVSSARCWWDRNGHIRWPDRIAASRFGQLTAEPIDYTPTEPLVVVEVDADTCFEYERRRHVAFANTFADTFASKVSGAANNDPHQG